MAKISAVENTSLLFSEGSAPSTPASGFGRVYVKTTGLFFIGDNGVEVGPLASAASGGAIVQVKTANSTTDDATTAATMQDSSLSLAFTPLFADSILHVNVDGECVASRAAGTIAERFMWVGILNSTNSVELVRQVRGRTLIGTSAIAANVWEPIGLKGTYTVNSTAARTFKLQYMAGAVTNITAGLNGSRTGGITMTIMEARP